MELVNLPHELLLDVVDYLDICALGELIRTCRVAHDVLTPVLYAQVFVHDRKDFHGRDFLHIAAMNGNLGMVTHCFLYASPPPESAYTCLVEASVKGHLEMVDFLLLQGVSADRDLMSVTGRPTSRYPLYQAILGGHQCVVKRLLKAGVNPNRQLSLTFEALARAAGRPESDKVFDLLIEYGFNVHHHDETNGNLLYQLLTHPYEGGTRLNPPHLRLVPRLLRLGVDVDSVGPSGRTALSHAVANFSEETVTALLDHGARVDIPDEQGELPIHFMAKSGDHSYIRHLAAQVNSRNNDGYTPLHLAVMRWQQGKLNLSIVKDLLAVGADMTVPSPSGDGATFLRTVSDSRFKPAIRLLLDTAMNRIPTEPLSEVFLAAAYVGETAEVRQLLERGDIDLMARTGKDGNTALMLAARRGHDEIITLLLRLMKDEDIDACNAHGSTALHAAVTSRQENAVRLVAERCIHSFSITDHKGCTPLALAARRSRKDTRIMEYLLLNGCSVREGTDPVKHLPLRHAVSSQNIEAARLLIQHGAPINGSTRLRPSTPLEAALNYQRTDMVELLQEHGASFEYPGTSGDLEANLVAAVNSQKPGMVRYFVTRGALLYTGGSYYWPPPSALRAAVARRGWNAPNLDIIRYLLEAGADPNLPGGVDAQGTPLVIHAVGFWGKSLLATILETRPAPESPQPPLPLDVDAVRPSFPSSSSSSSRTALFLATEQNRPDKMELLLRHGANSNATDGDGMTPLHKAAENGNLRALELLLDHEGTAVDAVDDRGRTAFLLAAAGGRVSSLPPLVRLDQTNINHRDHDGCSALILAVKQNNIEVVKKLLDLGVDRDVCDNQGRNAWDHAVGKSILIVESLREASNSDLACTSGALTCPV